MYLNRPRLAVSMLVALPAAAAIAVTAFAAATDGTIDSTNRYAWSENAGWIDFGTAEGDVHVLDDSLSGNAWSELTGWISLNRSNTTSCATVDYKVTNDAEGTLGGHAWSENVGWIDFAPAGGGVTIGSDGVFAGYAWGENIGWLVFNCAGTSSCATVDYKITTDWRPASTRASSSSPPGSSQPQAGSGGGGGGGRRGGSIATTIARARAAILLRFAERSVGEGSQSSSSDVSQRDPVTRPRTQTPRRTVGDRTTLIAERRERLVVSINGTDILYGDIPLTAWFSPYVAAVLESGVAEGYRDVDGEVTGEFGVANVATLAEVLKMALAAKGSQPPGGKPRNESAQGTWAAGYVATAEFLQLSVFPPAVDVMRPATRAEAVQTILEVFAFPIANQTAPFHDVPANHPFSKSIATAAFYELISGDSNKEGPLWRFRPDEPINRAEVSKLIALVQESVSR